MKIRQLAMALKKTAMTKQEVMDRFNITDSEFYSLLASLRRSPKYRYTISSDGLIHIKFTNAKPKRGMPITIKPLNRNYKAIPKEQKLLVAPRYKNG